MEFGLKCMAKYGLMLRQDRAVWLMIIFKPLLTPERAKRLKNKKRKKKKHARPLPRYAILQSKDYR